MKINKHHLLKKVSAACEGTRPVDHLRLLVYIALFVLFLMAIAWAGGRLSEMVTASEPSIEKIAQ